MEALSLIDEPSMTFVPFYTKPFDVDQVLFCIRKLDAVMELGGATIVESINTQTLGMDLTDDLHTKMPPKYKLEDQDGGGSYYGFCTDYR